MIEILSESTVTVNEFFPLQLREHLIFAVVGVLFFVFQFCRMKRPYQLFMAIGIAATLLLYLGEPFHAITGIIELVLMAMVVYDLIDHARKTKAAEKKKKAEEKDAAADDTASDGDEEAEEAEIDEEAAADEEVEEAEIDGETAADEEGGSDSEAAEH